MEIIKESAMTVGQDKAQRTNFLPGVLRGRAFECRCTVVLVSNVSGEVPGVAVKTSLRIVASDQLPPDGAYDLNVLGRIFKVRREGGKWPTFPL
jgi:hypothetical protein